MRIAPAALLLVAACSGKESAPSPSAASAPPVAAAAVTDDAAAPPVDRFRTLVVPEVDASLRLDPVADGPIVVAAILQVSFEGAPVVRVMGGKVDPKAVDDKGVITALSELYGAYAKATSPGPTRVNVAIVPQLRAGVLLDVMRSLAAGGQPSVGLLVRSPAGTGSIAATLRPDDLPVLSKVAIILTADEVIVGATRFKLTEPDVWTKVRTTLRDLGGAAMNPIVDVADDVRVQDLVSTIVAALYDDTGARLSLGVSLGRWAPADPAALEEEAARFADMLTASGDSSDDNGLSGEMRKTAPGGDLAAQLDSIRDAGAQVSIGGGVRGAPPPGRITLRDKKAFDETSLTPDVVAGKVFTAYMAGMKRCYKQALKSDPTLKGRLRIDLAINENGRVSDHRAHSSDSALDACIDGQLGNWVFAKPKDEDGEATEASFALTFELIPE